MLLFFQVLVGIVLTLGLIWFLTPDPTKKKEPSGTTSENTTSSTPSTPKTSWGTQVKSGAEKGQAVLIGLSKLVIYVGVAAFILGAVPYLLISGYENIQARDVSRNLLGSQKTMTIPLEYGKWSEPLPAVWPSNKIRCATEPTDLGVTIRIPGVVETYISGDAHYTPPPFSHQTSENRWQWKLETPLKPGEKAYMRVNWL